MPKLKNFKCDFLCDFKTLWFCWAAPVDLVSFWNVGSIWRSHRIFYQNHALIFPISTVTKNHPQIEKITHCDNILLFVHKNKFWIFSEQKIGKWCIWIFAPKFFFLNDQKRRKMMRLNFHAKNPVYRSVWWPACAYKHKRIHR